MYNIEEIKNTIICGDCLEEMKKIPDNSIDSIVTDPPYELGFMGKSWDNTGIANNKDMWAECLRVLKPGGHLLSFGGTRTYHRMASAIEDAGFEIRDMIEWVYGSGFPKSHNIGKNIEKIKVGGIKNLKQIGTKKGIKVETGTQGFSYSKEYVAGKSMGGKQISGDIPVYEINNEWEGWGTALKPAHEPICMARKPISEKTVAENCLKWGTGGINIDESRVESKPRLTGTLNKGDEIKAEPTSFKGSGTRKLQTGYDEKMAENNLGRFPANLIHDNSEEVRECFPETNPSRKAMRGIQSKGYSAGIDWEKAGEETNTERGIDDNGGNASRFFKSIIYQAKASKSERNKGCDGLEEKESPLLNGQIRNDGTTQEFGGFSGQVNRNNHPTVKPIALMEYLIKMVTPKGGIVLDPFSGSGSTLVAAKENGFDFIGIEKEPDYVAIAEARIKSIPESLF